jgi:hypothetical protein
MASFENPYLTHLERLTYAADSVAANKFAPIAELLETSSLVIPDPTVVVAKQRILTRTTASGARQTILFIKPNGLGDQILRDYVDRPALGVFSVGLVADRPLLTGPVLLRQQLARLTFSFFDNGSIVPHLDHSPAVDNTMVEEAGAAWEPCGVHFSRQPTDPTNTFEVEIMSDCSERVLDRLASFEVV